MYIICVLPDVVNQFSKQNETPLTSAFHGHVGTTFDFRAACAGVEIQSKQILF